MGGRVMGRKLATSNPAVAHPVLMLVVAPLFAMVSGFLIAFMNVLVIGKVPSSEAWLVAVSTAATLGALVLALMAALRWIGTRSGRT